MVLAPVQSVSDISGVKMDRGIYFSESINFFPIYFTTLLNFFPISCTHFYCCLLNFVPNFSFGWIVSYPKSREFARIYTPKMDTSRSGEFSSRYFSIGVKNRNLAGQFSSGMFVIEFIRIGSSEKICPTHLKFVMGASSWPVDFYHIVVVTILICSLFSCSNSSTLANRIPWLFS